MKTTLATIALAASACVCLPAFADSLQLSSRSVFTQNGSAPIVISQYQLADAGAARGAAPALPRAPAAQAPQAPAAPANPASAEFLQQKLQQGTAQDVKWQPEMYNPASDKSKAQDDRAQGAKKRCKIKSSAGEFAGEGADGKAAEAEAIEACKRDNTPEFCQIAQPECEDIQ